MEFRTRHMALATYTALAFTMLVKDIINTPETAIALAAPLVAMFTWDKITSKKKK